MTKSVPEGVTIEVSKDVKHFETASSIRTCNFKYPRYIFNRSIVNWWKRKVKGNIEKIMKKVGIYWMKICKKALRSPDERTWLEAWLKQTEQNGWKSLVGSTKKWARIRLPKAKCIWKFVQRHLIASKLNAGCGGYLDKIYKILVDKLDRKAGFPTFFIRSEMKNENISLDIQTKCSDIANEILNAATDAERTFKCKRPKLNCNKHMHITRKVDVSLLKKIFLEKHFSCSYTLSLLKKSLLLWVLKFFCQFSKYLQENFKMSTKTWFSYQLFNYVYRERLFQYQEIHRVLQWYFFKNDNLNRVLRAFKTLSVREDIYENNFHWSQLIPIMVEKKIPEGIYAKKHLWIANSTKQLDQQI